MEDLTFGEQVKIILSRKKMTIKQLAELIELQTGQKMSRQNLTQRLGRDNFQEQDMRMIAAILGCPFTLNIITGDEAPAELPIEIKKVRTPKDISTEVVELQSKPEDLEETEGVSQEESSAEERDMTIGEIYEIHEELDQLAEQKKEEELKAESVTEEANVEEIAVEETAVEETAEDIAAEKNAAVEEAIARESDEEPEDEDVAEESAVSQEEQTAEDKTPASSAPRHTGSPMHHRRVITPKDEGFEPVIKHEDLEEDRVNGDVNPYTGHEYQTNSVRVHPKRIGYVQVYDRLEHKWTDMTEWAFLGYQERKKALLGKAYEPPIYLD